MQPNSDSPQDVNGDKNELYGGAKLSATKSPNNPVASVQPTPSQTAPSQTNPTQPSTTGTGSLASLNIADNKLVDVASDRPISDLSNLTMSNTNSKNSLNPSVQKTATPKGHNWYIMGGMGVLLLAIVAVLGYGALTVMHRTHHQSNKVALSQLPASKEISLNVPVSANQSSVLFDQTNLKTINLNGDVTATGNVTALSLSGSGSGLTNLNASNLATGTVNNARLSPQVTLLGNSIPLTNLQGKVVSSINGVTNNGGDISIVGNSTISVTPNQANNSIQLSVGSSVGTITGITAGTGLIGGGTSGNVTLSLNSAEVTDQGNTFNGANQLVQLDNTGALPSLNGSNLTSLDASNITSGTLSDSRLNTNVTVQGNTFNGASQLVQLTSGGILPNLDGSNLTNLNASNVASGTLSDLRLSTNVTLQGNTFNGPAQLLQLNNAGALPAVNGSNLTNLDASNVTAGTLNDLRLSPDVTLQGNTFNLANQLVQLNNLGYLPVLNGSNITNLNATNISSGTISDSRLSSNVPLLNAGNTFTGSNTFSQPIIANSIQPTSGLTVGSSSQSLTLQGSSASTLVANSGSDTTTLGFSGTPTGSVVYNFDSSAAPGTYTVCTTTGNCLSAGGSVSTSGGTPGKLAVFSGTDVISDSDITDSGSLITLGANSVIQPATDSTTAFQIQDQTGTSNLFDADTTNGRIGIGTATPGYTLDVNGPVNATALYISGHEVCTSSGCNSAGGSNFYIQNGISSQSAANFNIQSAGAGDIGGVIQGAIGQTADLLQFQNGSGGVVAEIDAAGDINTVGKFEVNGSQISSLNLANSADIALLDANQTFSGNDNFTGNVVVQDATDSIGSFQIQNHAGTSNLFVADTTNNRIGIDTNTPGFALDVGGDINIKGSGVVYRINGVAICGSAAECAPSAGSSNYIQNTTSLQTSANFNIQSISPGSVVGTLEGAPGQTADLFDIYNGSDSEVLGVSNTGAVTLNTLGTANTSSQLCLNSSNVVSGCSGTGTGASFIQGGNSFGAAALLGTNDTNILQVETNSVVRGTFGTNNTLYLGNGTSTSGGATAAAPNNFSINATGSSTAGTAGANLTLNGGAGASSTTGSAGGNVVIQGGSAGGTGNNNGGNIVIDSGASSGSGTNGTVGIGTTNASAVSIGNSTASTTLSLQGGTGSSAVSIQAASGGTVALGTAAANTIAIGNNSASTVFSVDSGTAATNLFNGGTAHTINLATSNSAAQVLTVGSTNNGSSLLLQGGNGTTAISLQTASGGTIAIGNAGTNSIALGNTSTTLTVEAGGTANLFAGATAHTINIGTSNSAAQNLTIGSANSGSTLLLQGGTGSSAVSIQAATGGTIAIGTSAANTITLGNNNPSTVFSAESGTAATNLFNGATQHTINLATGAAVQNVTIGSTNSTSALTLQAGTGNLQIQTQGGTLGIANNAVAQSVQIGNSTAGTAVAIQGGTGSSAIGIQAGSGGTISLGTTNTANTITLGNNNSGTVFSAESGTGATNLFNGATQHTINLATGAAQQSVTVGSTNSGSTLNLQSGSGNINLKSTGSVIVGGSGSTSTSAFAVQNAAATPVSLFNVDTSTVGNNLVTNPSFEANSVTGWSAKGTGATVAPVATSTTPAYAGSYSMQVTTGVTVNAGASYAYTFAPNTQYTLSLYLKSASGTIGTINIGRQDVSGTDIDGLTAQTIVAGGWVQFTSTFTTGATITSSNFYIKDTGTSHTFYVDAVQLINTGSNNPSAFNQGGQVAINGLVNTPLALQNTGNSTTDFLINNAAGSQLFAADTTNMQIVIGNGSNTITLSGTNGITYSGNSRIPKIISLSAEYQGAVLDNSQLTSTTDVGTMTSGTDSSVCTNNELMNFYNWTSATTSQSYDIVVQVPIPIDFAGWGSTPITVQTCSSTTTASLIQIEATDQTGTASGFSNIGPTSSGTWGAAVPSPGILTGTYNPSTSTTTKYAVIRIRLTTASSGVTNLQVGNITLSYLSNGQ